MTFYFICKTGIELSTSWIRKNELKFTLKNLKAHDLYVFYNFLIQSSVSPATSILWPILPVLGFGWLCFTCVRSVQQKSHWEISVGNKSALNMFCAPHSTSSVQVHCQG